MKKCMLILLIVIVIVMVSCTTYTNALTRPVRPVLEEVTEKVPLAAQRNMLSMMTYAERLESLVTAYEKMVK